MQKHSQTRLQKTITKSRRIADQIPVGISYLTIEASPAVLGYGALLLNVTYPEPSTTPGDIFGNSVISGVTRMAPRGAQKFTWNPDKDQWEKGWTDLAHA